MAKKIKFRIKFLTPYGEFNSEVFEDTIDKYNNLLEFVKMFHDEKRYYQYLEDGTFICFSEDIIKQTMVFLEVIEE